MLFNSVSFIFLYLPVVFFGTFWFGRRSPRMAVLWLALASLVFYSVWDVRYIPLLLGSVVFNYGAGFLIGLKRSQDATGQKAKAFLIIALVCNLGLLGYFKYANFFLATAGSLTGSHYPALDVILPLGISFFTFTQIAFLVDVYRGLAREYRFLNYLLFVTYFPHLIAGPILHHGQMMPQFAAPETFARVNPRNVAAGMTAFALGLAKKVLIADRLSVYASTVFNAASDGHAPILIVAWTGALSYALQIYFDFSGYTDMAIGMSLMLNVRLPANFNSPYKATSIIDFWRRWHMTLSAFLRDYLYFPLGGNRKGKTRRYINLMITMLLGGLWHGAGWTYVIWGGLHGLYLTINHLWRDLKKPAADRGESGKGARLAAGGLTFLAVVVAWVFFRADNFASAVLMLKGMAGVQGDLHLPPNSTPLREGLKAVLVALPLALFFPNVREIMARCSLTVEGVPTTLRNRFSAYLSWAPTVPQACLLVFLFLACILNIRKMSEFLYFQF
jgi:D-alanyl-lipoteichoic acid acyltransferase DltB (MBOAT superfamily)